MSTNGGEEMMATEKRLIDVTEPLKLFRGWIKQLELPEDAGDKRGVESCIDILEDEPTVDAVEVVRCKDCKFYKDSPMGGKGCHTHFNGRTEFIPKNDNDFCSYGGKKIDEQKDC